MRELFKELPEACDNTLLIAQRCDVKLREGENLLPQFSVPKGETEDTWLVKESERGLVWRLGENVAQEYKDRLSYELGVMEKMGFPGYFLVVADLVSHAKKLEYALARVAVLLPAHLLHMH